MNFEITPKKQVGPVAFSMSRAEVRRVLGITPKEFKKTKLSKTLTDDFGFSHIYYDVKEQVEAIEFFGEDASLTLDGTDLLKVPYRKLEKFMALKDQQLKIGDNEFTSFAYGICASAENPERACDSPATSVVVFKHGYFD